METPEVEIAVLKSQYEEIKKALDEIKTAVTTLVTIKGEVSAQGQLQKVHEDKLKEAEEHIDKLYATMKEHASFIDRLQGAFKVAAVILSVVQAIVMSAGGWAVNTLMNNKEELTVMKQTVRYLEQQNTSLAKLVASRVDK